EPVDMAVIITPARTVSGIVGECVDAGVKGVVVISAGFKESGAAGAQMEQEILAQLRRGKTRLVGPNCLGVMSPLSGLNATFARTGAQPGNVAFVSQSGALCTAILDWSLREHVGFSAFVSVGSMLDVGWGDLINHLGDDPNTQSIILYMESIGNPRAFLSAAREVALSKPIIVIKAGRTEAAARAAASHTGALAGSDEVLEAAFRRSGVLRVSGIADLFSMAEVLAKQPRPKGPRLAILTNAGGPGVLATDALSLHGGELAVLSNETIKSLNGILPPHWSRNNPVDILGDAEPDRYAQAVEIVAQDANADGLLVILAPQAMTDPAATAEKLKRFSKLKGKPILASWMGGAEVLAGREILNRSDIPTFPYPDAAVRTFQYMWQYTYNLRGLYETPMLVAGGEENGIRRDEVRGILQRVQPSGRSLLNEYESKQLLAAYGIPTVPTFAASTEDEAVELAQKAGYPVVLKLLSDTITHKTDVGGVQLRLRDEAAVRQAYRAIEVSVLEKTGPGNFGGVTVQPMIEFKGYEVILGSSFDPQFGSVLLFGSGGQLVEVYKDRALALPPLNTTLARRTMEQTRIWTALQGVRGQKAADLAALERLMVRFSQLVIEQRRIREIDINPLLVSADGMIALDARVVLHGSEVTEDQLPKPAIRPYPSQYSYQWTMRDGTPVVIRPIRPEDEPLMVNFHHTLSERSVYMRYFHMLSLSRRIEHDRLTRLCHIDYDREMALVVEHTDPTSGEKQVLGVGRLSKLHESRGAEVAIVISDDHQRKGMGTELLNRLLQIGRDEKLDFVAAEMLHENPEMRRMVEKVGFTLEKAGESTVRTVYNLKNHLPAA
ncbi:MAG TPA: bifunctional acetate--CoA ligase family protein/GNAT family N-acetyltransferase, partial [Terriglobia bacterium]|nr:bifunctional acetate--CoA ligase family protein/GNAT family N-acetyltransferase [Terriglobia bacterium]